MELQIQGKNFEITDEARDYIEKKLQRLDRHLPNGATHYVDVEVRWEGTRSADDRAVVEVTLDLEGHVLRAEERAATMQNAMDNAADVIDRRLNRLKGRMYRSEQARKADRVISVAEVEALQADAAREEEAQQEVVRVKRFAMKPISVAEAVEQMEALGHSFFMFRNAETDSYSVLYRRQDGNYAVIVPVE